MKAMSGRSFGLDAVVLRYFNAYGPRQRPDMAFTRVVLALAEGRPFTLYGDGEQSRSFTYVADVVDATVAAMERAPAGAVYNVGGGEEATMNDAIARLERIAGRRLEVVREPAVPGDQRRTRADTRRIREALGWEPRTPLDDGLRAGPVMPATLIPSRRRAGRIPLSREARRTAASEVTISRTAFGLVASVSTRSVPPGANGCPR